MQRIQMRKLPLTVLILGLFCITFVNNSIKLWILGCVLLFVYLIIQKISIKKQTFLGFTVLLVLLLLSILRFEFF